MPGTGSFLNFFPGDAATNGGPTVIEVAAHSFLAATNGRLVTFSGDVRTRQAPPAGREPAGEPSLQSDELELRFSTNARPSIERLEARRNVIYEQAPG